MHYKSLYLVFLVINISRTLQVQISDCSVIEKSSQVSKPCKFPFVYRGKPYKECIFLDNDGNGNPWCSTKTDPRHRDIS